jgi:hypothetical protein
LDDRGRELVDIATGLADLAERLIVLAEPVEPPPAEDGAAWLAGARAELDALIRTVEGR